MNPIEKLEADKARHVRAVDKAIDKTSLLKTKLDEAKLLLQTEAKDAYGWCHGLQQSLKHVS